MEYRILTGVKPPLFRSTFCFSPRRKGRRKIDHPRGSRKACLFFRKAVTSTFSQLSCSLQLKPLSKQVLPLARMRGLPSQVKGAGLRTLSRMGSWVQIPPPAPICWYSLKSEDSYLVAEVRFSRNLLAFLRTSIARLFCLLLCHSRILNL